MDEQYLLRCHHCGGRFSLAEAYDHDVKMVETYELVYSITWCMYTVEKIGD